MTHYLYTSYVTTLGFDGLLREGESFTVAPDGGVYAPDYALTADLGASLVTLNVAGQMELAEIILNGFDRLHFGQQSSFTSGTSAVAIDLGRVTFGTVFDNQGAITALSGVAVQAAHGQNSLSNSGTIAAQTGINLEVDGSDRLVNTGQITAQLDGVQIRGLGDVVQNLGTIYSATGAGISIIADLVGTGAETIFNAGIIGSGGDTGIVANMGGGFSNVTLVNSGQVYGSIYAIRSIGMSDDRIVNSGSLSGDIFLGDGNDRYVGRGGTIQGDINLGNGDDSFDLRGGFLTGMVMGGAGSDRYFIDDASTVIYELAGSELDTVFAATTYRLAANIENLTLLEAGNFNGTGNLLSNQINGNSADNRLNGLDGNDNITGDTGNDRIFGGASNDKLDGGDGDDALFGGLGGDALKGADGDDTLIGGADKDTLTGGTGADSFVFAALGHTGMIAGNADIITDFIQGDDLLNLSTIDANRTNANANDVFTFIGSATFSNVAGQVHAVQSGGNTYVEMDVNADSVADAVIRLNGIFTMNAADFVL